LGFNRRGDVVDAALPRAGFLVDRVGRLAPTRRAAHRHEQSVTVWRWIGIDDEAFRDYYEGEWDSLTDYVEYMLEEAGFYQALDGALQVLPEDIRRHVAADVEAIAQEWAQGLHVAETPDGRVWVFDGR
jgi:antirestriction protein